MCVYEVLSDQDQGHWSRKAQNSLISQCKILMSSKSGSAEDRAVKFACSMGFLTVVDWMMWPPIHYLCHVIRS